jgi:hypothetical protein
MHSLVTNLICDFSSAPDYKKTLQKNLTLSHIGINVCLLIDCPFSAFASPHDEPYRVLFALAVKLASDS